LIIAGGSAYSRTIDFAKFRAIADSVGAYLMVDMAHFSGLVAGGAFPSPLPHAHVVTTTTHKTLRGPRGGMILTNDEDLGKAINRAVFPGLQGGPLMHVIAGKAVAFGEALQPGFATYAHNVVENCRLLAKTLVDRGAAITTGGTDSHLITVDLRPKKITGKQAEAALDHAGITCNKNAIPFDPEKPAITSGIRLGTPACTTRGFGLEEWRSVGNLIGDVFDGVKGDGSLDEGPWSLAVIGRRVDGVHHLGRRLFVQSTGVWRDLRGTQLILGRLARRARLVVELHGVEEPDVGDRLVGVADRIASTGFALAELARALDARSVRRERATALDQLTSEALDFRCVLERDGHVVEIVVGDASLGRTEGTRATLVVDAPESLARLRPIPVGIE
jgi:hypothetical protein